jgi:drug/metabolite transporter (DMT)-like permease
MAATRAAVGPGAIDYALLALLAAIWGSTFLLIKIAVGELPPLTLTAVRLMLAALFMLGLALALGERLPASREGLMLAAVVGFLGNALPFTLIGFGLERIDSGLAALLLGLMPLATMVLAHLFIAGERLTRQKAAGVGLGVAGLVVLVGPAKMLGLGEDGLRLLVVASASLCYAANAVITRRLMAPASGGVGLTAATMTAGAVLALPLALLLERPLAVTPGPAAIAATLALAVLQTALGQLLMFAIVRRQGATFFSQINFLVPVVGFILGALLMGERPEVRAYIALALILAGLAVARSGFARRAGGPSSK